MIEMLTCPIGVDWSVKHRGGRVQLHDVVRYDTVADAEAVRFPGPSSPACIKYAQLL
jgi:hypothetical protein